MNKFKDLLLVPAYLLISLVLGYFVYLTYHLYVICPFWYLKLFMLWVPIAVVCTFLYYNIKWKEK